MRVDGLRGGSNCKIGARACKAAHRSYAALNSESEGIVLGRLEGSGTELSMVGLSTSFVTVQLVYIRPRSWWMGNFVTLRQRGTSGERVTLGVAFFLWQNTGAKGVGEL